MSYRILCLLGGALLALLTCLPLAAQDSTGEADGASREVEESDEAFRRRMELEDARQRDLGYTLPDETYAQQQEKLDKLPEESRDNIRDQLVDIIVENGDWEPSDALKEYPYEPTAAAQADPELMQREQAAWDEQIEKYHRREAAAFGTYLGPVPGPGNPDGGEGGGQDGKAAETVAQDGGLGGGQQAGGDAVESSSDGEGENAAGTYEPYQSQRGQSEEQVSTAGVQQSALEFLQGMQGQAQTASVPPPPTDAEQETAAQAGQTGAAESSQAGTAAESAAESAATQDDDASSRPAEVDLTTPGIIAIEDLDKLEGTEAPVSPAEPAAESEDEQP
jgi:hypothetical protein